MKKITKFGIFAIVLSILLIATSGVALYQLFRFDVLPSHLMIPVVLIFVLLVLIFVIWINFMTHGIFSKIVASILVLAMVCVMGFGDYYLYKTGSMFDAVTESTGKVKNTVSIIVKADSDVKQLKQLKSKKVGKLKSIDAYGTKQCIKAVKKDQGSKIFETKNYAGVSGAVDALYDGDVDAIILNESYRANVEELEGYENFSSDTKVIFSKVYYTEKSNTALVVSDITSTPFTILISGNDTYGDIGEVSRSDVNMLVTVNPVTSTVLMTSMPRDTYVETACDAEDGCQNGAMDKLTHTGMHGINTTKKTIENLFDIDINYTFRVNFSSVVEIVDALGGIDVEVEEGNEVDTFYADSSEGVVAGTNHLDGKRALAFARERKAYADGDYQRVRNQQEVLRQVIKKATSPSIITNYASLMDALQGAFETNMSMDQITDLIKYQLQAEPEWTFENYQITGAGNMLMCAELGQAASVQVPDMNTVRIAKKKIQAVIDGESSTTVAEDGEPDIAYYESQASTLTEETEESYVVPDYSYAEQNTNTNTNTGNDYTETPIVPEVPTEPVVPDTGGGSTDSGSTDTGGGNTDTTVPIE